MVEAYQADSPESEEMTTSSEPERKTKEDLKLIDTMKAPIIKLGKDQGLEVVENYDLGAGPVHVAWIFKPVHDSLPKMRLGFICLTRVAEASINESLARGLLNLIDKLILLVPDDSMTKQVKDSIESMPDDCTLQLRKYITVLTPTTLVPKSDIEGSREQKSTQTSEVI